MVTNITQLLFDSRDDLFKDMRGSIVRQFYPTAPVPGGIGGGGTTNQILNDFVSSFSRFAGNQATTYDNKGGVRNTNNSGNPLEVQVRRALSQVLGRSPNSGDFIKALNSAFPLDASGQVVTRPARSVVALYNASNGNGTALLPYNGSDGSNALVGQLSTKQAALYRQATLIAGDALSILLGLTPFKPEADLEEVEALRSILKSDINALTTEFGRIDEPRVTRVETYLRAMNLHVIRLGRSALIDDPKEVTTINDEAQTSGFILLKSYIDTLTNIWKDFNTSERVSPTYSLSELIERANIALPIVAQTTEDLNDALYSVGFLESEQRSRAARFSTLNDGRSRNQQGFLVANITIPGTIDTSIEGALPDITVFDLIEWLKMYTTEGPARLTESGQFGLDFVTEQGDSLFRTISPIVGFLKTTNALNPTSRFSLLQVLSNERVSWALDSLLSQLKALAEQAD